MSDFLLIAPGNWTEIPNVTLLFYGAVSETDLRSYIDSKAWQNIQGFLEMYGIATPEGKSVAGAQMMNFNDPIASIVNDDGETINIVHRLWVLYE